MSMLKKLALVERNMVDILINSNWKTLDIDYHPPYVQRVYTEWDGLRVMLHRFPTACGMGDALYHPHPWVSAMKVLEGEYIQNIGHEEYDGNYNPYPVTDTTIVMKSGSSYEMMNPKTWHRVIPQEETYTLMITGGLFSSDKMSKGNKKSDKKLEPLDINTKNKILSKFMKFYSL